MGLQSAEAGGSSDENGGGGSGREPAFRLERRSAARVLTGERWLYESELTLAPGSETPRPGAVVRLEDRRGRVLARGLHSPDSQIRVRVACLGDAPVDEAFWDGRFDQALAWRAKTLPGEEAVRWINAEGDGLPGIVVDRYGAVASIQLSTVSAEQRRAWLVDRLMSRPEIETVVERNDGKARRYEGLEARKGHVAGVPLEGPVIVQDGEGIALEVDVLGGQKTGAFLDQRAARRRIGALAREGDRALDVFSYAGGFGLHLARGGARVTCVDISPAAAAFARRNAVRSGLGGRMDAVVANAFDLLAAWSRATPPPSFDLIVLDPPAFAPNKRALAGARRGYKELNLRAFKLLKPGGVLLTCSCSAHVTPADFESIAVEAARDAGREVQLLERLGADVDHPAPLPMGTTHYLKSLILRVI